jgi:hypothetical protein
MTTLTWMQQQQELSNLLSQLLQSLIDVDVAEIKIKHLLTNLETTLDHLVGVRRRARIISCLEKYVNDAKLVCDYPLDQKKQRSWSRSLSRVIKQFHIPHQQHDELMLMCHMYQVMSTNCMKLRKDRNFFDECAAYHQACNLGEHISHKLSQLLINSCMQELCAH